MKSENQSLEILMECTLKFSQGKGLERFSNGEIKQTTNGVKYILIYETNTI